MPQFLVAREDVSLEQGEATLRGDEAHHLLVVLRARPGKGVLLFDGTGNRWSARLTEQKGAHEARLGSLSPLPSNENRVEVSLVQSVPKGDRWEWVIEKGTELGVSRFVPVHSRRSVAVLSEERQLSRLLRWRGIASAAAKQCERGKIPAVEKPVALSAFLSSLASPEAGEIRVVLTERLDSAPALPAASVGSVLLAVGPEGGWAEEEIQAFHAANFLPVGLGPRILRSDTAALAGLVMIDCRLNETT